MLPFELVPRRVLVPAVPIVVVASLCYEGYWKMSSSAAEYYCLHHRHSD